MKRNICTQTLRWTFALAMIALAARASTATDTILSKPGNLLVSTYSVTTKQQTLWAVDAVTGDKHQLAQLTIGTNNDGMAMTKDGQLYIAQDQQFRVVRVNMQNGAYDIVAGNGLVSSNPNALKKLVNIHDMEAAEDGSLWVLDAQNLYHFNPNTSDILAKFPSFNDATLPSSNPWGIEVEPSGNLLKSYMGYTVDGDGGVVRLNPATGAEQVVARLNNTSDAVNGGNGHVYALDSLNYHGANVIDINESTGSSSILTTGLNLLEGLTNIVYSPRHGLYVNDVYSGGTIYHIDPVTGAANPLASMLDFVAGIAVIPVPEPATLTLAATGLAALALILRRRS